MLIQQARWTRQPPPFLGLDPARRYSRPLLSVVTPRGVLLPGGGWRPFTGTNYGRRPTPAGETAIFGTSDTHLGSLVPAEAMSPLTGGDRINMTRIAVVHRSSSAAGNIAISTNGYNSNHIGWRLAGGNTPSVISNVVAVLSSSTATIAVGETAVIGVTGTDNGSSTTWQHWKNGQKTGSGTSSLTLLGSVDPSVGGDDASSTVCAKSDLGIPLHMAWDGPLTDDEMRELMAAPWRVIAPRRIFFPVSSGGASGITGTLGVTLADATAAGTAALALSGAGAATLEAATVAAIGALALRGQAAITLDAATLAAASSSAVQGALSVTLDEATVVAAAVLALRASAAVTLDDATLVASAVLATGGTGALAVTLDDATLTAAATIALRGAAAITLDDATGGAAAALAISGALGITLAEATLVAAGASIDPILGTAVINLADAVLNASGAEQVAAILSAPPIGHPAGGSRRLVTAGGRRIVTQGRNR